MIPEFPEFQHAQHAIMQKLMPACTTCLPETGFLLQNCVECNHCGEDEEGEAEDVPDVVKDAGLLDVDHL